ncbi:MAG TPA: carbohydrate-binding module family 14 protein [Roseovarius sp.]|nr:carbohydrate-binding module family 14 protein [Roseovarius sp.]
MTFKTLLTAAAFTVTSAMASFACPAHDQHVMSCAEGTAWDADAKTCVPQTTS